jgi:phage tail tape-measure protein
MQKRNTRERTGPIEKSDTQAAEASDRNPDPISGAKGAHPIGTGAGAASGAVAGAAIGTVVGGPVGLALGGAAGAVVGGLAGKGVAEAVNPTAEDEYWRQNYSSRPYATAGTKYDTLQPAYRYGWEARSRHDGKEWKDVEKDLRAGWNLARGNSKLAWDDARFATHDAWDRMSRDQERMDDDSATRETLESKPSADRSREL